MSFNRNLEMICLRKASQASRGIRVIWAYELGENPAQEDIDTIKDLFTLNTFEDLKGEYSFSEIAPSVNSPDRWENLLNPPKESSKFTNWKSYFNYLSTYYLKKADEFAKREFDR